MAAEEGDFCMSESPLEEIGKKNREEAVVHIRKLHAELQCRKEELNRGIEDALAELYLLKRSFFVANSILLGDDPHADVLIEEHPEKLSEQVERLRKEAEPEVFEDVSACAALFKTIERVLNAAPSGDRPSEPRSGLDFPASETPSCPVFDVPVNRRLQTFFCLLTNFFTGIPLFLTAYFLLYVVPQLWPFMVAYNVWYVYDVMTMDGPRKKRPWFRNNVAWKLLRDYFPVRLRVEDPQQLPAFDAEGKARNYLFVMHPHGVHSFGSFVNFATNASGVDERLPGLSFSLQTLGIQFKIPLWRELVAGAGCGDASKRMLTKVLTGPPGSSAVLVVGGAEESLDAVPGTLDLVLRKRKGFIRVALQTGASLVPCFSFGENDVYRSLARDPAYRPYLTWVKKTLGFALPLVYGRGIFNYAFGMLPHRRQITTVVGTPIHLPKWEKKMCPGDKELAALVDEIHEKYTEELLALFNRNKDIYGLSRTSSIRIVL